MKPQLEMTWRMATLVSAAIAAIGCTTAPAVHEFGRDVDLQALDQLKPGASTAQQAAALLGRPADSRIVGQSGAVRYVWSYARAEASARGTQVQRKYVVLQFDQAGLFERLVLLDAPPGAQ